ncbi:hypothetical protein COMNV_01351 [Commensalibacter sp. Nvir]|uniref:hypothetical protein n=1 Tax=Commensalibacter sp. Nvir TaxID=3069817 RepID=UPI002D564188|nr:hypothetical protein COMNV_01351 [Commensalibacter sp. Nvir]
MTKRSTSLRGASKCFQERKQKNHLYDAERVNADSVTNIEVLYDPHRMQEPLGVYKNLLEA